MLGAFGIAFFHYFSYTAHASTQNQSLDIG